MQIEKRGLCSFILFSSSLLSRLCPSLFSYLGRFLTYHILFLTMPIFFFLLLPSRSLQGGWGTQTECIALQTCFPIIHHNRRLCHTVQKRKYLVELNWLLTHRDIRKHSRVWCGQCQPFPTVKHFTHGVGLNKLQRQDDSNHKYSFFKILDWLYYKKSYSFDTIWNVQEYH